MRDECIQQFDNDWIDQDIVIDFELPTLLKNEIEEAERLCMANDVEYFCVAEDLDVTCKGFYRTGHITEEQWDRICAKYHL